jgi:hypothetical protein
MTEPDAVIPTDQHLDDEQLSAVVDGAASADESGHAAACPECGARLATWQEVVGRIGALSDHPSTEMIHSRREEAVAAALSARRRPDHANRTRWLASIAAAAVFIGGLSAILAVEGNSPSHKASSTAAPKATASSSQSAQQQFGPNTANSGAGAAAAPSYNIGSIATPSALNAALGTAGTPAFSPAPATISFTCLNQARTDAGVAPTTAPQKTAELTYQGVPAQAFAFLVGGHHVTVVERTATCTLLARTTY